MACVVYQACTVWIASVYIPPQSTKNFTKRVLDSILTLEGHPVFVDGDFNRCDQHHFQTWDDFLVQAGLTDVDPNFPTYPYQGQESALDRFLVPSLFLDTTQLFARVHGRYRIDTCHHKALVLRLKMKPRLRPHPLSEKHQTIPTQVFLDPTATIDDQQSLARQPVCRSRNTAEPLYGAGGGVTPVISNESLLSSVCTSYLVKNKLTYTLNKRSCANYMSKAHLQSSCSHGKYNRVPSLLLLLL